jgi:hypothetical protein
VSQALQRGFLDKIFYKLKLRQLYQACSNGLDLGRSFLLKKPQCTVAGLGVHEMIVAALIVF